jgi:hypothetical protein
MRGRGAFYVMPAQAGIQSIRYFIFWIPAFAGMTDYIGKNCSTAKLNIKD